MAHAPAGRHPPRPNDRRPLLPSHDPAALAAGRRTPAVRAPQTPGRRRRLAEMTAMLNVLVLDPELCSSFLIKSILLGAGYAVSVSADEPEAARKIATGLFDVAVVDLSAGDGVAARAFIRATNALLPGLPVLALGREEHLADLSGLSIFLSLPKPIRVARVTEAVRRAVVHLLAPRPAAPGRCVASLPAEVTWGLDAIPCRVTSVSDRGVLLEPADREFDHLRGFDRFFDGLSRDELALRVNFGDAADWQADGRIAFAERSPDRRVQRVGLAFAALPAADAGLLKNYIALAGGPA
ncbi:MAG: hypothetical protein HZA54_21055 [Planctomycetes bacterium]|nr:hypothetical protein [Planctomycetota bacterium]